MTPRPAGRGCRGAELQEELRDLLRLAVVGDHLRWVLRGDGASDLAAWLEGAVPQWRAWAAVLARCMVERDVAPDGRVKTLARDITRQWVPSGWLGANEARRILAGRLGELIESRRSASGDSDDAGPLAELASGLEAQLGTLGPLGPWQ